MDLENLIASEKAEFAIVDPNTGKDTDIKIGLYSPETKQYNAALKKYAKLQSDTDDEEEKQRLDCEFMAEITFSLVGAVLDGKEVKYSIKNAAKVYGLSRVIRDQVKAKLGNIRHFLPKASQH